MFKGIKRSLMSWPRKVAGVANTATTLERVCNTAGFNAGTNPTIGLDHLREHYGEHFPIVGLVPALKPAVLQTRSKVVAVLATTAILQP
jgi:glutamate racemase